MENPYQFRCPSCGCWTVKAAAADVLAMLLRYRARIAPSQQTSRSAVRGPISDAELIDFFETLDQMPTANQTRTDRSHRVRRRMGRHQRPSNATDLRRRSVAAPSRSQIAARSIAGSTTSVVVVALSEVDKLVSGDLHRLLHV